MVTYCSDSETVPETETDAPASEPFLPVLPSETPVPEPETETPTAELSEKPDKGWFQKLIESIFGSSCRCG